MFTSTFYTGPIMTGIPSRLVLTDVFMRCILESLHLDKVSARVKECVNRIKLAAIKGRPLALYRLLALRTNAETLSCLAIPSYELG